MTAAAAQRPAPSFTFPDLPEDPTSPKRTSAVLDGQLSFDEQPADDDGYYDEQPADDDGYYDEQPAEDDGYYDEQPAEDDGYYDEQPGEGYGEEYDEEYYDDYEPNTRRTSFWRSCTRSARSSSACRCSPCCWCWIWPCWPSAPCAVQPVSA